MKASGAGFVTRFDVDSVYLSRFPVQTVGGSTHTEYWVPAEQLSEFNSNIVGLIEVIIGITIGWCNGRYRFGFVNLRHDLPFAPAFYELHVWAWEQNPVGSFADWNTQVSCDQQPTG